MKRKFFLKALCCLLAVLLLSGCAPKSPLLAHADDDSNLKKVFVATELCYDAGHQITNAEGACIFPSPINPEGGNHNLKISGTMEHIVTSFDDIYRNTGFHFSSELQVPFSKYFVATAAQNTEFPYYFSSKFTFYGKEVEDEKECGTVNRQEVYSCWNKVVHHCNNVIEIEGDLSELAVEFQVDEFKEFPTEQKMNDTLYRLEGEGGERVIVALVDGEILTEGMAGNYTVTKTDKNDERISPIVKEYDKDGNLLSTTEE